METRKITLKAARVNANLSQRKAAELLNICPDTLRNYESGTTVPDWDKVADIERVYGYPADFILFTRKSALSGEAN